MARTFTAVMLGVFVSLAGCGENHIQLAQSAVKEKLSDPDSATFKDDRVVIRPDGKVAVCGAVNAKNRMGGYVGYRRYIVDGYVVHVMDEDNASTFAGRYLEVCSKT